MQWYSLSTMMAIWLITITIELTSQSEILIIRHGRSRSRHSSEKEHARWASGLRAITDNRTISASQKDALLAESLEREPNGEMSVVHFYEHNGTLTQSNEFNGTGASFEINYTFGPMPSLQAASSASGSAENVKRHHRARQLHEREPTTTEMSPLRHSPHSASARQPSNVSQGSRKRSGGGKRREFITDIKSTVDKGIQYLKAHENLDEVEIEINDYNARRRSRNDESQRTAVKGNKIRSQTADQREPEQQQQQQQRKSHKQIKTNGSDSIVTASASSLSESRNSNKTNPTSTNTNVPKAAATASSQSSPSFKLRKSTVSEKQQQRHAASKHIKIHQAHNEIDMNINSNLADVFYVPTPKTVIEKAKQQNNPHDSADERMLSDEPAATAGIGNKMEIKESLMEKSNQHNQTRRDDANQNRHGINSSTVAPPPHSSSSGSRSDGGSKRNATHANGFSNKNKNSTMHTDRAKAAQAAAAPATTTIRDGNSNDMMIKDMEVGASATHELASDENVLLNDEINNDDEFINSIGVQNDDGIGGSSESENTIDLESDFEEHDNAPSEPLHDADDLDLSDLDETSRNNRKNLMRGRDVVTRFLQIVESQHMMGNNCTAGTALNLGEGVVDRYAQDRFRVEAEVAVNRANMLTRIFKMSPFAQRDINLLHASVLSMVEFDEDIFAAGHCFDDNQYPLKKGLFCPFAHRLPPPEAATYAKDLANEYHYLGNTSEWFFLARKNAEKVIARNEQYIKAYHSYSNDSERHAEEILSVKYEDGRWSKPYYDCGGGNIWMLTYTVPFFGYDNGTYFFKGTSGIDIDLRRVDIDQCPQKNTGAAQPLNIFAGTDKCKQRTTECLSISGLGFRRGSYKCICRKGFYYPDVKSEFKFFNGTHLEEEYAKWMQSEPSSYNDLMSFECLPCAEGCDVCEDASPCVAELNWPMRTSILILACAVIGFLPPAAFFTWRYQQVKIVKAASPALLRVIAMGAFLIYCTTIVMYPNPSLYTCVAKIWLREIGFSLTYGALMLKTWRISVIFRVRSAKAIKITDASLIKKLSLLCGFVSVFLLIRTLVSPPDVIVGRTADNLKAFLCKTDWWDHTSTSLEVLFLAWGVRLCIVVRKAPSEFNESRFISMAIYNEFLLTCFLNVSMLFLQSPANPDLLYIIFFCHTQLTVTLLLALIFGSKVYLVFRNGGKSLEDAMHSKSTAAKFISRPQPRTYASASSVNASTGQLHMNGADNRLSENEAVEEIKQLAKQLQNLYDRIPQKSTATSVILTLLDICRTVQNAGASNQLTLKPPPPAHEQSARAICANGSVKSAAALVDKETNTSRSNLAAVCVCRTMTTTISDKCDNANHLNNSTSCNSRTMMTTTTTTTRSKCCEANNQITCSTNSINFDNLQLQCMCSSDNNSLEDFPGGSGGGGGGGDFSFRERLLNLTGASRCDDQPLAHSNSLRKRNSELVLGTNFDTPQTPVPGGGASVYKNSQSHRISKTFDSCDNIFSQRPPLPPGHANKSNHSLSTESDQKSIPYCFLERPSMKMSQSEDRNLRELKIALSSTLPAANSACNSTVSAGAKGAQTISHPSTTTSSTSNSSKMDKISLSLSTSSASEALTRRQTAQVDNQNDNKNEDNKAITAASCDNKAAATSNVNNNSNNINSSGSSSNNNNNGNAGNNGSGRRKGKGAEGGKLAIDLNDRSKYTEEVSV